MPGFSKQPDTGTYLPGLTESGIYTGGCGGMSRMSKAEAEALVGRRIRKEFANGWFEGVVAAYNSKRRWYHIKYKVETHTGVPLP